MTTQGEDDAAVRVYRRQMQVDIVLDGVTLTCQVSALIFGNRVIKVDLLSATTKVVGIVGYALLYGPALWQVEASAKRRCQEILDLETPRKPDDEHPLCACLDVIEDGKQWTLSVEYGYAPADGVDPDMLSIGTIRVLRVEPTRRTEGHRGWIPADRYEQLLDSWVGQNIPMLSLIEAELLRICQTQNKDSE